MTLWFESFVFGFANSIHCACMCGPLALAFQGSAIGAIWYQLGRVLTYGSLGVVLGGLGATLGSEQLGTPTAYVAFVLAAGLIVLVVTGDRLAVAIPWLGNAANKAMARTRTWSPTRRAGVLGLLTPLLPCGLLWSAFAGATVAGSASAGLSVMAGFALGSLPLLVLAQGQAGRLTRRLGPRTMMWVQRCAMLMAAGMLVWRGTVALSGNSCCH